MQITQSETRVMGMTWNAAGLLFPFHNDRGFYASLGKLDRTSQAGRPCADNEHFYRAFSHCALLFIHIQYLVDARAAVLRQQGY